MKKGSHGVTIDTKNPHGHLAQVSMDPERATQIQTALIKNGYLTGEPTGKWDAASISAMQKLQSDNGWQTKIMPDSRAIIKLGLGPGSDANIASAGAPAQ
jgi:peptidoglycan hydrolase-like protein with peptidoglycan-binding domain